MGKSNAFETEILELIFNNGNIANVGDATGLRGATLAGDLYLSLHTSDPGEAGTQTTNEIAYTGYARVAVPRSAAGFTVSGDSAVLANDEDFPKMTAGAGGTVTYFGVGSSSSGAGLLLYSGVATPNILIQAGTIPRLEAATSVTED
jgi:hypothetical protein